MGRETFREKSYWLSSGDYSPNKPLEGELSVDVAIVGGGFTGLSAAYHLITAEPGLNIALLESQVVGFGASGRNAGFSMTLFGLSMSITALRFGKAKAVGKRSGAGAGVQPALFRRVVGTALRHIESGQVELGLEGSAGIVGRTDF
jgi:glycine/D-amino acid oxidase-like deaminating enzyme